MKDERKGLPSLSSLHRLINCPPSFKESQKLPQPPSSPEATFGTECHAAMETGNDDSLTDEQKMAVEKARDLETTLIMDLIPEDAKLAEIKEERLWGFNKRISGKTDRIIFWNQYALIIDYKFGRNSTGHVKDNEQLKGYAVLLKENYPELIAIDIATIQPLVDFDNRLSHHTIEKDELLLFAKEIENALDHIEKDTGKKNPSLKSCEYCNAKTIYDEAQQSALIVQSFDPKALTVSNIKEYLDLATLAEKALSARVKEIKSKAVELLDENPDAIENYKLIEGRKLRSVNNTEEAFTRLASGGLIDKDGMMKSVSIKLPELEKAVAEHLSCSRMAAKDLVKVKLDSLITEKQSAPFVKRK